jgi:hypothetical protein
MCLRICNKKKYEKNNFFASLFLITHYPVPLKTLKNGVGSVIQRYGAADLDPHQNVTDPGSPTLP